MSKKKILTICPSAYPGTTSVLKHYSFSGLTDHNDELSDETVKDKDFIIFGGWHPMYYDAFKKVKANNLPIGLFWTSSVGQADFSNGGIEVSYINLITNLVKRHKLIDYVICGTPMNYDMFAQILGEDKVILLPYAYDWSEVEEYTVEGLEKGDDWVDLFCPADTRKNILVQIHAAKIADAHVHFSGLGNKYRYFSDLIGVKYTDMGWMPKDRYYRVVQTMKLGMQVTFAETFDYVVAEHFATGTPCLISTVMTSWVDKSLNKYLLVKNPDDPLECGKKIKKVISMNRENYNKLGEQCKAFMREEADRRNIMAKEVLEGLLE